MTGRVLDETKAGVPGATVIVKGSTRGVITGNDGTFSIDVKPTDVIEISYLGYETQSIPVGTKTNIVTELVRKVSELEAVTVVAYGKQRKESIIGAINTIDAGELEVASGSLSSNLAGKLAGIVVMQRTGEPGSSAEFWIRGQSTFGAKTTPLVLVDGIERDMDFVDADDIATFSILKDATATALYGVRGANGIILITTKRGTEMTAPQIRVKAEFGITQPVQLPELANASQWIDYYNELYRDSGSTEMPISDYARQMYLSGRDPDLYPNVDWVNTIFKDLAMTGRVHASVTGGSPKIRYYVSASYYTEGGMFNVADNDRYNAQMNFNKYSFRSNIDMSLTKTTTLSLEIGANMTDAHQPRPITSSYNFQSQASELFSACYQQDPITTPVRVPLGYNEFGEMQWGWGAPLSTSVGNPAERLFGSGYNKTYRTSVMSQIILKQNLDFLTKGLDFTASFSYDVNTVSIQSRGKYSSLYAVNGVDDETGLYSLVPKREGDEFLGYIYSNTGDRADEFKAQFNYERVFNERHRVGAMAMYYQRSFNNLAAGSSILALPYRKQGLAFRATYSYDDRYFIEYNMGYNGSENFKSGERFGVFPAGAIGYLISNEPFWKVKWINHLKIRGSIGLVGSDVLAAGRFAYLSTWESGLGGHYFGPNATWSAGIGEAQEGVLGLTWEKGLKKDLGLELKMFDSMVSIDLDYFHEKRWDILIQRSSVPGIAGLNQQPLANMGRMTNHGFEATAEFNHHIGKVNYRIYGNFSFARNKITEKDEAPTDPWRMRTGHPLNQQFGLIALGLFEDQDEIDLSPEQKFGTVRPGDVKYLDYNGDGVVDAHDEVAIGYSRVPEINYGFGLQINWKGLDFGAFFRGQAHVSYSLGGSFFPFANGVGKGNLFAKAMDRWSEENPNPNAFYPRLSASASANNQKASTRTIYDGSLLRLSDLEVGYTFRGKHLKSWGCQSLRVYFVGSNLLLFSPWDMWDPESGSTNGSNYPLARKFNLGVRISF